MNRQEVSSAPERIERRRLMNALPENVAAHLWCVCVRELSMGITQTEATARVRARCKVWARCERRWKRAPAELRAHGMDAVMRQWSRDCIPVTAVERLSDAALARRLPRRRKVKPRPVTVTVRTPDGRVTVYTASRS